MLTGKTDPDEGPRGDDGDAGARAGGGAGQPPGGRFFTASPRGARLARRHAVRWMEGRGFPPACEASCSVALVVAELCANAVRHGYVAGRGFTLRLERDEAAGVVRVEVADASAKRPPGSAPVVPPDGESGRGLMLVGFLAVRWGSEPRDPCGKTVRAEVAAV